MFPNTFPVLVASASPYALAIQPPAISRDSLHDIAKALISLAALTLKTRLPRPNPFRSVHASSIP